MVLSFVTESLSSYATESRIARHLTVVGTTQQTGLAERMNKTLMDKVRSPSTAIETKTHMEMWSGHPGYYRMLRVFGCVAYSHIKQGKLEPRAVKCVFLGYREGVKGYRLYRIDNESPKIVTSRNVVFNESVMYKDTLKDSGVGTDKSVEELQVEVELQELNNHTLEEDQTDQEDGNDVDARDQETDQTPDLTDYQLVRDKEPRTRTKPLRFQDESNMATYAFAAAEEEDTHEPLTYQEALAYEDSSRWKAVMEEEIDSLRKNKTWELVNHLVGQKLVSCKWLFKIKEGIEGVQKPSYKARSLEELIYMRQPPGYEQGNKVCLLKKSLYDLKQSPRQWYRRFNEYMMSNGFKHSSYDSCVYYRSYEPGDYIYILLYVDDMLIACKSKDEIGQWEIGLDAIEWALQAVVEGFPGKNHWEAVKWILKYLRGTTNVGLVYGTNRGNQVDITGFVDSDYARIQIKVEAKYMALTEAVKEAIWLRGLLEELGVELNIVAVNCHNQSAIHLSRNHVFHKMTKHINERYHLIRAVLEAKTVEVQHNVVDALMKVVPGLKLQHCLELLSVGICRN
ncbi:retrovirus-related pol polyprotein from transposon TNT 1-94 [Tanacetum coccineum]|uniref:Retrovirus-related pol polyprotein from transposon TNT 1-94 n=1 Tax=Tanacetum coccineum TaxID=301880 RepID=A0ABQ5A8A1_9ASTR